MKKTGILKTPNGHIEYYIDSDEKMEKGIPLHLSTHTNDYTLLLKLDPFDIFNLWQVLNEYVTERQFQGSKTKEDEGEVD